MGPLFQKKNVLLASSAVAAMEFALIAPILIVLFFAVYDSSDAMLTYQEVFAAARAIAASASNIAVQGANGSTKLYYGQVQFEASAIFAQMPSLRSGFHSGIKSITISSVNFEPIATSPACSPGPLGAGTCQYRAYVVWSVAYAGPATDPSLTLTPALRACAQETGLPATLAATSALNQVGPTAGSAADLTTIRTAAITSPDLYPAAPDPIIVVDIHYQYTPLFNLFLKNPIDFWANGYWPLRSVQATQLNANGSFTALAADQQYTGLVSTGVTTSGTTTGPYTISGANVYPATATLTAAAPPPADYCISPYYPEPPA